MSLWTPDSAALDQRAAHAATLVRALADVSGHLDYWNRRLRELDPHLQLVKAPESATHPDLRPGYFHVLRLPPGGLPMVYVVEGPDGEFREPDSGLIRELQAGDMWSDRAMRAAEERRKARERERERADERLSLERREELKDRIKASLHPGVRVSRSIG